MKAVKAAVQFIFLFVGGALALVLALLLVLAQWPGLLVNESVLTWMKPSAIEWENVGVAVEGEGLLSNSIGIRITGFCTRWADVNRACFESGLFAIAYDFFAWPPRLSAIGPVQVAGAEFRYFLPEEQQPSSEPASWPKIPSWLQQTELRPVEIEVRQYQIFSGRRGFSGRLGASSEGGTFTVSLHEDTYGQAKLSAVSEDGTLGGPWRLEGDADLEVGKNNLTASFQADPNAEGITGQLSAQLKGALEVEIEKCRFAFQKMAENNERGQASLHCPLLMPVGEVFDAGILIRADAETTFFPSASSKIAGKVDLLPLNDLGVISEGSAYLDFALVPEEWPKWQQFEAKVNLDLTVPSFERLVRRVDGPRFFIPAPLRVLKGKVAAALNGEFNESGGQLNLELNSQLHSRYQRLVTLTRADLEAVFDLAELQLKEVQLKEVLVRADVRLTDVRLSLPPLGVSAPGQVLPDPRIRSVTLNEVRSETQKKGAAFPLRYAIRVRTARPLRLNTEYTPQPIPVELDLTSTDRLPLRGSVEINAFPLEVMGLRRRIEPAEVYIRATERQMMLLGEAEVQGSSESAELMYSPEPGEQPIRPSPKLPLPLAEILSGLAFRVPVSIAVVESEPSLLPRSTRRAQRTEFQWRKRY